jgi:hypothetical protein
MNYIKINKTWRWFILLLFFYSLAKSGWVVFFARAFAAAAAMSSV